MRFGGELPPSDTRHQPADSGDRHLLRHEVTRALLADKMHYRSSSSSQNMLMVRKELKMGKKKLEVTEL